MRILFVNKFLYPKGGSETYMLKLGAYLESVGHEVQYFGMESAERCVGNAVNAYTSPMDFHGGSKLSKLTYPIKTIYSVEARRKIRLVLEDFQPDVCHLNNFNYQLTPAIILEIHQWRKQTNHRCRVIYTAHDYQLVCPNHMCRNPITGENCQECLKGSFRSCIKGKCIHGSTTKSIIGAAEAVFWRLNGAYQYIDSIICCSNFVKEKMDSNSMLQSKTVFLPHFVDSVEAKSFQKREYILYFGRYSEEKGLKTLIRVCQSLSNILFVFAGDGPLGGMIKDIANIKDVGFQTGNELERIIGEAQFSILPSEWYEIFGLAAAESINLGTPVLGANIGGIPEVIQDGYTGELFESGNEEDMKRHIQALWTNRDKVFAYSQNGLNFHFVKLADYACQIVKIYRGEQHGKL